MDEFLLALKAVAPLGPLGGVCLLLLVWIYRLYSRIDALEEQRNQDSKNYVDLALKLQEKVYQQIEKLSTVVETITRLRRGNDDE